MDKIINDVKDIILTRFLEDSSTLKGIEQFIFPCKGNTIPIKDMTPFPGKQSYDYLAKNSLFSIDNSILYVMRTKPKLKLYEWVPLQCRPLIKYCSGYYNHADINWMEWHEDKQILYLAAVLRSPRAPNRSTWEVLIEDISSHLQYCVRYDPNVSPATIKEIVYFLCSTINTVNHEINCIQAKLSNAAERTLSTFAFAYAFKSLWETKTNKRLENKLKTEKEKINLLQYFLQKIEIRKMFRGDWDREKMKNSDHEISSVFALDLLGRIKRGVLTTEQPIIENLFSERKELETPDQEIFSENNFVVQYVCNRNELLRNIFFEKWSIVAEELYQEVIPEISKKIKKQVQVIKMVLSTLLDDLESINAGSSENKAFDSDSNFEIADKVSVGSEVKVKVKESPFKAMVLYLRMYLDPNVTPGKFRDYFTETFKVDGVKMKKSDTYKLCDKPNNPNYILDEDIFKKLDYTKMFTCENIFNISEYVTKFLSILDSFIFELTREEFTELVLLIQQNFERDVIGCPNQCPSCGKLCERELHPNDGKCQIKTGHQICSMGGKVWNDKNRAAVLYMCDDYKDNTNVVLQGRAMTWGQFRILWEKEWDWTMPNDKSYLDLQDNNRDNMIKIWNKFGKGILNYYSTRGTQIFFVPYDTFQETLSIKYYICFVIDGTVSMATEIGKARISVGQFMEKYKERAVNSEFKIIIYRDHCDKKIIEKYPFGNKFTPKHVEIQEFLSTVKAMGGGDYPEAVLDGLATATSQCDWETSQGVKNIIIHIFDAPPHGDFPDHTLHHSKSNPKHCCCCNQGTLCQFDWDRDVWDNIVKFNIQYNGINTGPKFPEFEAAMKRKLGELCADFQTVGQEVVNEAILQIFIQNKLDC
ncbi:hypothetical protein LOD99_6003 [Oopsacas minuta]|uniref:Hemicentin-1-like von Willebrand factor A domain-containing protein n=1 Tax=Oopsacas minuta TaxID=111878 RepID=A0AAV7JNR2_9METZ|nr:hypothetical protein LOD99_6003 [Oopsacas minuta]